MRYFLLLLSAAVLIAAASVTSCNKRDEGFTQALVIATNDLTPTGCGYLLRFTDGSRVKPVSLPSAYRYDSLAVLVKFTATGTQSNCMPQTPLDIVSIDDIKREL